MKIASCRRDKTETKSCFFRRLKEIHLMNSIQGFFLAKNIR